MSTSLYARLFKIALDQKVAFVPGGGQQASGPDGAPVPQPGAGGPPGGAPMDPAAGGGMPPAGAPAPGGAPMDPSAGGAPMDPAAAPPAEPPPEAPPMEEPPKGADGEPVTPGQAETVMGIVERTLEAVGKKKTPGAPGAAGAGGDKPAPMDPAAQPGPITGLPGLDPSTLKGPLPTPAG